MRNVIRLGDPTSHGGRVVSVSADHFMVDGKPVARVGDLCSCPIAGHSECKVAEGSSKHLIGDVEVAYDGHKTTCGAKLIATEGNFSEA